MRKQRIYFDYAATTPLHPLVLRAMQPHFGAAFGNPSSLHAFGQEAIAAIDEARETVAHAIGAHFREIIFTGSATEANNLALRGTTQTIRRLMQNLVGDGQRSVSVSQRPRLIISAIEHESVLETARDLEKDGVEVIYLPVNGEGFVDLRKLKEALDERTVLISVMYVNNEIGVIQPIAEIAKIILGFRKQKTENGKVKNSEFYSPNSDFYPLLHTDAVQALQYLDCDVNRLGVDLMTLSAHKIYGPKGIGALYVKNLEFRNQNLGGNRSLYPKSYILNPVITGGGQEFGLRSGTQNTPLVVGFAKAVECAVGRRREETKRTEDLSSRFWNGLKKFCPEARVNGVEGAHGGKRAARRSPHILNVYFPGKRAEDLLVKLDLAGIAISAGAACAARSGKPSYVIDALGHPRKRAEESVRVSFGRQTTVSEVDRALRIFRIVLGRNS